MIGDRCHITNDAVCQKIAFGGFFLTVCCTEIEQQSCFRCVQMISDEVQGIHIESSSP